jgi:hypothetical protein
VILAQASHPGSATALITALAVIWVVMMVFRMTRAFAITSMLTAIAMVYVGWSAGISTPHPSQGMILGVWHMWLDSMLTVWNAVYDAIGLDSLAVRLGLDGKFS